MRLFSKSKRFQQEIQAGKMNKGEQTRQRIIEEAAPIFNQRGFNGCSMHDLMEATGLEKGGLYRHFASKEELAVEAFRYALRIAVKTRTDNLVHIQGAIAKLLYIVERFVEAPSPIAGGCPLMNTAIDADDGNPALRLLAREGIQAWKKRIAKIVEEGIGSGEIRNTTESRQIANSIVATLEGALMISRIEGTRCALLDARKTLSMMLEGIRSRI
jgi:TetR/AcrR family transcriptional repressor of nem operon